MTRLTSWIAALMLLLAAGTVHGLWTERWRPSDVLERAAARLERVPLQAGDWQGQELETDAAMFALAGARGYWARLYTHPDGSTVQVILMCGRAGKMAVHTPEVCYRGAGYDLLEAPVHVLLRDEADEEVGTFWSGRFAKQAAGAGDLQLDWAWNAGSGWQAPANPRWEFRGRPFLYKLYAGHEVSGTGAGDATAELLRQLVPVLNEVLLAADD